MVQLLSARLHAAQGTIHGLQGTVHGLQGTIHGLQGELLTTRRELGDERRTHAETSSQLRRAVASLKEARTIISGYISGAAGKFVKLAGAGGV